MTYLLPTHPSRFPDLPTLERGLAEVLYSPTSGVIFPETVNLDNSAIEHQTVAVLSREPSEFSSTFAAEEVNCRLFDGRELKLFCKYSYGHRDSEPTPRRGLAFEVAVYQRIVRPLPLSQTHCYGAYHEPHTHEEWLVLEHLEDALWASHAWEGDAMRSAVHWIARFHKLNAARLDDPALSCLARCGTDHYLFWSQRSWQLCERAGQTPPWLRPLHDQYESQYVPLLAAQPATVVHGEYTPRNALWHAGAIKPIDWETAMIAVGEIDLVTLLYDWDEETIAECEVEYQQTRWPDGPPTTFPDILPAARIYSAFHWIYGGSEDIHPQCVTDHLAMLHAAALREGLL